MFSFIDCSTIDSVILKNLLLSSNDLVNLSWRIKLLHTSISNFSLSRVSTTSFRLCLRSLAAFLFRSSRIIFLSLGVAGFYYPSLLNEPLLELFSPFALSKFGHETLSFNVKRLRNRGLCPTAASDTSCQPRTFYYSRPTSRTWSRPKTSTTNLSSKFQTHSSQRFVQFVLESRQLFQLRIKLQHLLWFSFKVYSLTTSHHFICRNMSLSPTSEAIHQVHPSNVHPFLLS